MRGSLTYHCGRNASLLVCAFVLNSRLAVAAQEFQLTEELLSQWITRNGASPMKLLNVQLDNKLARLHDTCDLTSLQVKKLEIAGQGDIARFNNDYQRLCDKFVGKTYDQNKINEVYQQIQPLVQRVQNGILDDHSLFTKVLVGMLDAEQSDRFKRLEASRVYRQYRAKVMLFIVALDGIAPMLDEQRESLLTLLLNSTKPPKLTNANYDWYYALWQISTVPEEDVKTILDEAQLRCFRMAVRQGAAYAHMMKQVGMVPMDEALIPDER